MTENKENSVFKKSVTVMIEWSETALALVLFFLVLIGLYSLLVTLVANGTHQFEHFHTDFQLFLGNILLLIVGLELALLLIKHRIESIVEIMFFVIARKLAVTSHNIYEMGVGVLVLAALFATRKYLMICNDCRERKG